MALHRAKTFQSICSLHVILVRATTAFIKMFTDEIPKAKKVNKNGSNKNNCAQNKCKRLMVMIIISNITTTKTENV